MTCPLRQPFLASLRKGSLTLHTSVATDCPMHHPLSDAYPFYHYGCVLSRSILLGIGSYWRKSGRLWGALPDQVKEPRRITASIVSRRLAMAYFGDKGVAQQARPRLCPILADYQANSGQNPSGCPRKIPRFGPKSRHFIFGSFAGDSHVRPRPGFCYIHPYTERKGAPPCSVNCS